jgi:hypothetical protein
MLNLPVQRWRRRQLELRRKLCAIGQQTESGGEGRHGLDRLGELRG